MSRQSCLKLCRDKEFHDMRSSMSRHSVLCRDSGARHCVATRLCVRDRDALSRQCSAALHRNNVALHYVTTEKATRA